MKSILFIHQSSELYGSDKTLLFLVETLQEMKIYEVTVVLPKPGPLSEILISKNIPVLFCDVIKLSRSLLSSIDLFFLPYRILKSYLKLRTAFKNKKIDIVHSNTLAVLIGAIFSKFQRLDHVWHVHEIIEKPKLVTYVYSKLLRFFSSHIVVNSHATEAGILNYDSKLMNKAVVIWNGLSRNKPEIKYQEIQSIRKSLMGFNVINNNELVYIGLVGRINKWKGHQLLLFAFEQLLNSHPNVRLVFVGSTAAGQEYLYEDLIKKIDSTVGREVCSVVPFQNDIWSIYDSLDIVVVPSIEPEPFGLVAVEAMLSKKPVIAANHGGVAEIVIDNKTGLLFQPCDENSLLSSLTLLVENRSIREKFGEAGNHRALNDFSLNRYVSDFIKLYNSI